ncbi:MAG: hypothetical protein K2Y39_24445 [Candidatus Obscuribacterales bacterium]|nr:hypothetical protein [Candidatus Obscuribacterales bacterium]
MAVDIAFDNSYNANPASYKDFGTEPNDAHLLNAFLLGAANGIKDQVASIYRAPQKDVDSYDSQTLQLAAQEKAALASRFRAMMASLTPEDLEASNGYQHFKHRMDRAKEEQQVYRPAVRTSEVTQIEQPKPTEAGGDVIATIQKQLQKAGQIMATGDIEAGKAAFLQAIDFADKNYNQEQTVAEIRQLQNILQTNTFEGRQLTSEERLAVHGQIMNRFGASLLPFQLRSGSIQKDQAGYATVLRQYEQNESAEAAYKDAVKAADAIPVREMKKQIQLIADELGKTNDQSAINVLSAYSASILGGKDAQGNDIAGAIKTPITARKDLMEFYVRPTMKEDGTADMASSTTKDGIPKFVPDVSKVFKPEEANKVIAEIDAKYKEILGIDLGKDPSKDAELAVFRATVDANSPKAIAERKEEKSYGWESGVSNFAAAGASLLATLALSRFGAGKLVAKVAPSLYKAGNAAGELSTLGKVTEFAAAGTIGSVTRNQMMTNVYGRNDETLTMSIANGFASSIAMKAFFSLPKAIGDKVVLRGFTAETATARAAKTTGTADEIVNLAKLREANPGLILPKTTTTFGEWAAAATPSQRALALGNMSAKFETGGSFLSKLNPVKGVYNLAGQPFTAAENLSSGAITMRRAFAGATGMGTVTTFTDAADAYSRLWPKMLNGEAKDKQGNTIAPTFENMVVRPIYKDPLDNSFVSGSLVGGFFGRPGTMFAKPWGDAFFYTAKRTSIPGKVLDAAITPLKSATHTILGVFGGSTNEFILRGITPRSSDVGAMIAQNLQVQTAQIFKNFPEKQTVEIYDEQLKRNGEKLTDRRFVIKK